MIEITVRLSDKDAEDLIQLAQLSPELEMSQERKEKVVLETIIEQYFREHRKS